MLKIFQTRDAFYNVLNNFYTRLTLQSAVRTFLICYPHRKTKNKTEVYLHSRKCNKSALSVRNNVRNSYIPPPDWSKLKKIFCIGWRLKCGWGEDKVNARLNKSQVARGTFFRFKHVGHILRTGKS